jgi:GNAT superfamily N-acetyltransferase
MENVQVSYRFAAITDLELLVRERLRFIRVDETHAQYGLIREKCRSFFETGLRDGTCAAVLAEETGRLVGTAVAFSYLSVPSARNPEGRNAYITSVFVEPDCRRRGIASGMVEQIVLWGQRSGCANIMLTATDMGAPLYRKLGFRQTPGAMLYAPEKE